MKGKGEERIAQATSEIKFSGFSMYPSLRPGDTLLVRDIPPRDISMGDIVCVKKDDKYIAHRVVIIEREKEKTKITTKGDNIATFDPPLYQAGSPIKRVVMIKRGKTRLKIPRFCKIHAILSRMNLTYGIIKGRGGRVLRSVFSKKWSIKK
jgi:signal peptidase I